MTSLSQKQNQIPQYDSESVALASVSELLNVIEKLRTPESGCPWDLKQSHHSLRPYLLEEAYEAVEAMSALPETLGVSASLLTAQNEELAASTPESDFLLKDELGDVLLQVLLHSQLANERGAFNFSNVCQNLSEKLVRRHPHVFEQAFKKEDSPIDNPEAVTKQWAEIKAEEKKQKGENSPTKSILEGVKKGQPALMRALETSQKAVKVGFAWPNLEALWDCVMSEYKEFRDEIPPGVFQADEIESLTIRERLASEMGDILFATVNLARQFKINPEIALTNATHKFTQRFHAMEFLIEAKAAKQNTTPETIMSTLSFDEWDQLWRDAKAATNLL